MLLPKNKFCQGRKRVRYTKMEAGRWEESQRTGKAEARGSSACSISLSSRFLPKRNDECVIGLSPPAFLSQDNDQDVLNEFFFLV